MARALGRMSVHRVADVMTYRPVTVRPGTPVAELARLFGAHPYHCLPVTAEGWLRGVVTRRDLSRAASEEVGPAARVVESLMTPAPVTVGHDTPLEVLLERMVETGHWSLPVVIGGLLIGIVTRKDLLGALGRPVEGAPHADPIVHATLLRSTAETLRAARAELSSAGSAPCGGARGGVEG